MTDTVEPVPVALIDDLRQIIEAGRGRAAQAVNSELVWLYWHVGTRLRQDVVGEGRGAYGERVVAAVAKTLAAEYGRGFSKRNLHYMLRFAEGNYSAHVASITDPRGAHELRPAALEEQA